jgi:DNA transposition AAA+ family ATPase
MSSNEIKFRITFPTKRTFPIIETMMMRLIIERTLSVHILGALVIWYGISRIGKTTTAQLMVDKLAEAYDPDDPNAFRAVHYEVGKIEEYTGNETKRGIKSLYNAVIGTPLDEAVYIRDPPEVLAARLVHGAKLRNIQMVFVDEAGLLSLEAIRGMVLVRDVAENMGWTLTIVFIGMDDLPIKVTRKPQIVNRIHEWCFFKEYDFDDTWKLLV